MRLTTRCSLFVQHVYDDEHDIRRKNRHANLSVGSGKGVHLLPILSGFIFIY